MNSRSAASDEQVLRKCSLFPPFCTVSPSPSLLQLFGQVEVLRPNASNARQRHPDSFITYYLHLPYFLPRISPFLESPLRTGHAVASDMSQTAAHYENATVRATREVSHTLPDARRLRVIPRGVRPSRLLLASHTKTGSGSIVQLPSARKRLCTWHQPL